MLRPLLLAVSITLVLSFVLGIIITIQTGAVGAILYYGLFIFTTYLLPIVLACYFYHFSQPLFRNVSTAGRLIGSFLFLLLWFEIELFAWSFLRTSAANGTSTNLQFIINDFIKKNRNLWTGVLFTSMAIVFINYFNRKS
jgi:hypothetical protein